MRTMSGRNPVCRGGRSGRGYRSNYSNYNNRDHKSLNKKKMLEDYYFYVGSVKQASNYELAADFIINHIKKEYDRGRDIAESLCELQAPTINDWMPMLVAITSTVPATEITENKQNEMEYKAKLTEALHRIRIYKDNLVKSYALIWECCNTAMQSRLE